MINATQNEKMGMKDFSENKSIKVNCNFCSNEMECTKEMLEKSKKHMCYECFIAKEPSDEELKDVHIDIPIDKISEVAASGMADRMVEEVFSSLWVERKNELKEMSKKDLAEKMFGTGIYMGVRGFIELIEQMEKDKEDSKQD